MRWRNRRQSGNVIDRRGTRVGRGGLGGPGPFGGRGPRIRIPTGARGGRIGWGGLLAMIVILAVIYALETSGPPTQPLSPEERAAQDDLATFSAVVLADTEEVWAALMPEAFGRPYREPQMVLFTDAVRSGCGFAGAAVGPFYCPADERLYLDLGFFQELDRRFGAPGDFAQAYVIAHEVGHHVQALTGIAGQVRAAQARLGPAAANELSVRQELQADCFAGVWAKRADLMLGILETGDIHEALTAAGAIGDDTLQRRAQGYVVPDSFTHGTSEQRQRWFMTGFETGNPARCDTFAAASL